MKYENAKDVLPPDLITQIQKYAAGKLLYIPQKEEPKAWGSLSGTRQKLLQRNQRIFNEYKEGKGIGELAEEYFLSADSIKKIVYGKNSRWIPFHPTIDSAMEYHEAGLAEEWFRTYCMKQYGETFYEEQWVCDGLLKMPLRLIRNCDGETVDSDLREDVPLILWYNAGSFICRGDGRALERLKSRHVNAYPAFVLVTDRREYASYVRKYGMHFRRAEF